MRSIPIILVGICFITSCATLGQEENRGQRTALSGLLGAASGCGIALAVGKDCLTGVLIGGAAAAALGWVYESQKVATSESTNTEARTEGIAIPENRIVLQSYDIKPNINIVKPGETVSTTGTIKLIGHSEKPPKVDEELVLVAPGGKAGNPQITNIDVVDGAGEFKSTGKFIIPQGFKQGKYVVRSALYLDGKVVAKKQFTFQVS